MKSSHFCWLFLCFCLAGVNTLFAQSEVDALRFSTTTATGTARSLGMGGGTSAMGADLSAPSTNPAGLGLYRRSDFVFSPAFRSISSNSTYLDGGGTGKTSNFGIANIGAAFQGKVYTGYGQNRAEATRGFKSYTIALGYNQLENYYRQKNASGYNPHSSITDNFAESAQGIPSDQLNNDFFSLTGLAWQSYLIDWIYDDAFYPIDGSYWGVVDSGRVQQTLNQDENGVLNEWYVSGAMNFSDFLYVGLTIGIQSLRYEQNRVYKEADINDVHNFYEPRPTFDLEFPFSDLELTESFTSEGSGLNANLGVIVRPIDRLRIGVSAKTPTNINIIDNFSTTLDHRFVVVDTLGNDKDTIASNRITPVDYNYIIRTPYRITFGGMYLLGKAGFISTDVEIVDYGSAKLKSAYLEGDPAYYDFEAENTTIKEVFKTAVNIRLGGELRLDPLRIRAGAAFYGSPVGDEGQIYEDYQNLGTALQITPKRRLLTLGLGFRQPNYYIDVAYINQLTQDKLSPYATSDPEIFDPVVITDVKSHSFVLSLGYLF